MLHNKLSRRGADSRSQSETIAVLVLAGLTLVFVAVTGAYLVSAMEDSSEPAVVAIEVDLTPTGVELSHEGGAVIGPDELLVSIAGDDVQAEQSLAEFDEIPGERFVAGDEAFDGTEQFLGTDLLTGEYRVQVVHEPSNTLLIDESRSVVPETVLPFTVELSETGDTASGQVPVFETTSTSGGTTSTSDGTASVTDREGVSTAFTQVEQTTVVDFDWPAPNCPDAAVSDLDTYFSGDTSVSNGGFHVGDGADIEESPPGDGCVLRSMADDGPAEIVSLPGEQDGELDYYPERGDSITFEYAVYDPHPSAGVPGNGPTGSNPPASPERPDFEFRFGVQDSANYYYVRIEGGPQTQPYELVLGEVVDGNDQTQNSTPIPGDILGTEPTYHPIEIEWGLPDEYDATQVTFDGDTTVETQNTSGEYDGGGIGFAQTEAEGPSHGGGTDSYVSLVDSVQVEQGIPELQLQSVDTPSVIATDESLTVTYTVENTGDKAGTDTVALFVEDSLVDTDEAVTVRPDEPTTGTLTVEPVAEFLAAVDADTATG